MPTNAYIEIRNGGYYIAGTRISLDVVVYDFRDGRSADAIFEAYPSIGSLAKVYGAITFILEHPQAIEAYLAGQNGRYEEFKAQHPLTPDMIERFERMKQLRALKRLDFPISSRCRSEISRHTTDPFSPTNWLCD